MLGSKGRRLCTALVFFALAAAACGGRSGEHGELRVVTAFYPIEFAARLIGGDLIEVVNLTPPGGEPHDLELKASDVVRMREAGLVLYLGRGFQPAVDDAIEALETHSVVDLLEDITLKPADERAGEELSVDPHVWLSPALMRMLAGSIAGALAERLPARTAQLRTAANSLDAELVALDEEFRTTLSTCKRREIFTSHAAFAYLADRYGLTQVPIAGLTPETEPSSKRLQEIAAQATSAGATTIFFETLVSPRVSQAVARIVGAKTAVLDPLEGLSAEDERAGADYLSVMRSNLGALAAALGCTR